MKTITATELARNLRQVLDRLSVESEEIVIERNHQQIGRLVPWPGRQSALEAMADLYRTLPEAAGRGWLHDSRRGSADTTLDEELRNPWHS